MSTNSPVKASDEPDKHPVWGPRMKQVVGPLQALAPDNTELMYDSIQHTKDNKEYVWVWYQPRFGQWFMNVYLDAVEISTDEDKPFVEYRAVPEDQVVAEFKKWLEKNYEPIKSIKRKDMCDEVVHSCFMTREALQIKAKVAKKAAEYLSIPDELRDFVRISSEKINKEIKEAEDYDLTRESVRILATRVAREEAPADVIQFLKECLEILPSTLERSKNWVLAPGVTHVPIPADK